MSLSYVTGYKREEGKSVIHFKQECIQQIITEYKEQKFANLCRYRVVHVFVSCGRNYNLVLDCTVF